MNFDSWPVPNNTAKIITAATNKAFSTFKMIALANTRTSLRK